jgi:hypothetical protein
LGVEHRLVSEGRTIGYAYIVEVVAMAIMKTRTRGLAQNHWRKIKNAPQRLVLCRLMIDIMGTVHGAYAPPGERFGTRLETFFIGLCVALGDIEGKPLSMAKITAFMRVPRTTVIRRLDRLQHRGLIDRRGHHYYIREKTLNSFIGMQSYQQVRRALSNASKELSALDRRRGRGYLLNP